MILNLVLPSAIDDLLPIELAEDSTVASLKELASGLVGFEHIQLQFGTKVLSDATQKLSSYGLSDNDIVIVKADTAGITPTSGLIAASGSSQTASAADDQRIQSIANLIRQNLVGGGSEPQPPAQPRFDPNSSEGQNAILQAIQQANIQRNLEEAEMHIPESFVQVTMLYVELRVNKISLQAFVDCGAQSSIMSLATAEKCNLIHLMDTRYKGVARGIGETKICGRIHRTVIEAGGAEFDASFVIVEKSPLLFGLDLLYRHRCCIDLKNRSLRIADVVVLPFLDASKIEAPLQTQ